MRALITGVTGFVGPYLAAELVGEPGAELFGMALDASAAKANGALPAGLETLEGDITDDGSIRTVLEAARPQVVFHLAGASSGAAAWHRPAECLEVNALGTLRLLEGVRRLGLDATTVVASSGEVYGSADDEAHPLTEESPLRPLSPYAASKASQDLVAAQYPRAYGMRVIRLRLFNHTGPRHPEQFVASSFARQIARIERGLQEPVIRVGNLDARRDFVDVRDVARAYRLAARRDLRGEVFNVCSGRAVSIRQVLDLLRGLARCEVTVRTDPERMRPADIPLLIGDPRRFREATGWAPTIPIERTLADLLEWWRQQE
ncbi:MAG TPA: GDP-mannose 4,6-dehydratase [Thermoanaerobaculales bacterium]|nr:GDP-mannose 4,6-dehydratase [Thermoanaerobaculales bacterium]